MKSSILSIARAALVAATLVVTLSATSRAQEQEQSRVHLSVASSRASSQDLVEGATLQSKAELFTQALPPAPWCYTDYGRFPMLVALPPGYACHVNVAFWPYVLNGITGY
jgi:hypothetical protein